MSASISHELNNPLSAIRSFAENGKRFLAKGEHERTIDNLTRISALTDRMATISQQLKSFARKTTSDERVDAKIHPIVISAVELMTPQLRANQIDLTINIQPADKLAQAKVNLIQLEQVLINLLTNAIEALKRHNPAPADGSPSHVVSKQIAITIRIQASTILIHIDDSGSGLPPSKQQQIFEPFYTTKQNGLGLGLSISRQIMHTMEGDLTVDTSEQGGSRFTVEIQR
jgi:two-component system C4-dicarboxylate transport sensor histidine kinase DctB